MMLYPSDHVITVEELREIVYDDDPANPVLEDDRYDVWIARYPDDWRMAAYAAADRLYYQVAARPNRIASDGDSISWPDARIAALKDKRDALKADIEADGYGEVVTITGVYLTPDCTDSTTTTGVYEWQ